ncbi:MAG: hypothetical protein M1825_003666 [Sarcosagium campestre]|nr:MAG: hypothetical protein M1825_003666 [Sarcosagium campestre]
MESLHKINPFAKRESHSNVSITTYKVLTIISWLVSLITTFYYLVHAPHDDKYHGRTIWGQNSHYPTPFSLNKAIVGIYWVVLWILQVGYVWHLFSSSTETTQAAASVGSHFIFNNLLHFGFVMLWVRERFWLAELLLVVNFLNLNSLYLRHPTHVRAIHIPVVSGPLAWTFVALFWDGAAMVNARSLPAGIVANIFIWTFLFYGLFFIAVYKDYTVGLALSTLTAALGVHQFFLKVIALQWIFAFTIMAALFVLSLGVAYPAATGKSWSFRRSTGVVEEDRERAPLLDDN